MELILSFAVFLAAMIACLATGVSMALALALGVAAFAAVALRRGFAARNLLRMFARGMWESRVVVIVMLMIGCLTSLWRQTGTIAFFTYYGVKLIPPGLFLFAAFALTSIMSYALGTSFGVAGTMGVILMTIARASGVNLALVGGAVMSGIYFGDRGSPAASSASLVASETHSDVSENFRLMLRSSALPMALCAVLYLALSRAARPEAVNSALLGRFAEEFRLSPWCLLPTILLLAMAFAGIDIKCVMLANILASALLTAILQGAAPMQILRMTLLGYAPRSAELTAVLAGGGAASMLEVEALLLLSSGLSGIFEGTRMLESVEGAFSRLASRLGRFPAMCAASLLASMVFCNQTIGVIMCRQCMARNYADDRAGRIALMLDIENSVITLCGLVPWCIACSVPLRMLGCGISALPFAAYLYLVPVCWQISLRMRARRAA